MCLKSAAAAKKVDALQLAIQGRETARGGNWNTVLKLAALCADALKMSGR
jgi:hypothetical protein